VSREADDNALSPSEQRLLHHLESLRADAPEPSRELPAAVIGTVRWQSLVRPYLVATGGLAAGLGIAAGAILGGEVRR
jgi:hypothetical protein